MASDFSISTQNDDILTKTVKKNSNIFSNFFQAKVGNVTETSAFPEQPKHAHVKQIFKEDFQIVKKKNAYQSACFPIHLKWKVMIFKHQCGFWKRFSVANLLLPMIEKWIKSLNKRGAFGALLTWLFKTFHCLHHELLITNLHVYETGIPSCKLLNLYLTTGKQRVKLSNTDSLWSENIFGALEGSVARPLLFNMFLSNLF